MNNDNNILSTLRSKLAQERDDLDWSRFAVCHLGDLDWESPDLVHGEVDDTSPVAIEPGWYAEDIGEPDHYEDEEDRDEAAQRFVDSGDWDEGSSTTWVHVYTFRTGYCLDEDGDLVTLCIGRDSQTVAVEPEPPECHDGRHQHDWQSPYSLLGGLRENPGVQGHGGGIVMTEVCAHCGAQRTIDTWAQDPETGEQGLTSISYEDPSEETLEWSLVGIRERFGDFLVEAMDISHGVYLEAERIRDEIEAGKHSRDEAEELLDDLKDRLDEARDED